MHSSSLRLVLLIILSTTYPARRFICQRPFMLGFHGSRLSYNLKILYDRGVVSSLILDGRFVLGWRLDPRLSGPGHRRPLKTLCSPVASHRGSPADTGGLPPVTAGDLRSPRPKQGWNVARR